MLGQQFKAEVREKALELGFLDMRVSSTRINAVSAAGYEDWIAAGMHGEMRYLENLLPERTRGVDHVLEGARSVLVFIASYYHPDDNPVLPEADGIVRVARYALGTDYHFVLKERLSQLTDWLAEKCAGERWRTCVDSAPIMERTYAAQAGLGFIGKNGMLITWLSGSYTFIAEVLTTAEIEPDDPRDGNCGNCTRCIDACPTAAIVSPGKLDARRCISYLTIEKKSDLTPEEVRMTGEWAFGCDVCQDVCPYNKHPSMTSMEEFAPGTVVHSAEPPETFTDYTSHRAFRKRFHASPILRAGPKKIQKLLADKFTKD